MSQSSNNLKQTLNNIEVQILGAQFLDDEEFTSLCELIDEFGHKFLSDNEFTAAVATSHEDIPAGTSKKFIQIEEILEIVNEIRLKIIDATKDQTEIADIFEVTKTYEAAIAAKLKDPSLRVPALPQSTQKIIQFLSHLNIPPEAIGATAAIVASSANQAPEEALSRLYQVVHSIDPAISTADIVNGLSPLVDSLSGQPDVVIKKIGVTSEIPKLAENPEAALKITTAALLHPEGADTYSQGVFANADITVAPEVLSHALNSHLSPVDALAQAISLYTGASLEAARQVATSTAAYNLILQYNPHLDPNEKLRVLVDQLGLSLTEKESRGVVPNENSSQVKDIQTLLTVSPTGTAIPPSTAFFIVQNLVDPHTALPLSDTYTSAARKIFQAQSATTLAAFTELFGPDAAKLIINNNLHLAAAQLAAAADPGFNYLHTANTGALLVNFISAQPGLQSKKPTTNPELQRYHDLLQLFHGPLLFQSGSQVAAKFHLFITSQPTNDTVNRAYSNSQYSQSVTGSVGSEFRSALSLNISHLNLFNPLIARGQNTLVYRGFNAFANSGLGQKFFATSIGKGTGKVLAKMVGSKLATKLGLQAVGSVVPGIGNFIALVAGVVLDLVGKVGKFLFGDTFSNLGKDVGDAAKGGAVALLMGASGVGGAITGAVSALIAGIIAVMSIVVMALATPIVIGVISIPIAVAFFLFIINTGAYITPPSFGTMSEAPPIIVHADTPCPSGTDWIGLSFPNTGSNPEARRAWDIVNELRCGFWSYWNHSPGYDGSEDPADYWDESLFISNPNPRLCAYFSAPCENIFVNLFWCTLLPLRVYNENGNPMPYIWNGSYTTNSEVMKNWFISQNRFISMSSLASDPTTIPNQVHQGDVALIYTQGGDSGRAGHVSIIWSVNQDFITTIDSNAASKNISYTISSTGAYFGDMHIIGIGKRIPN